MARLLRRRAAVLGSPVAHSLSPLLHRAAYDALRLDWCYDAIECDATGLPPMLAGLDESWVGLSLTRPLKEAVLPLLDEVEGTAGTVGAVNTVLLDSGRRVGHNTDVGGVIAALRAAGVSAVSRAGLLGGGATARSALAGLAALGCSSVLAVVRDPARSVALRALADQFGVEIAIRGWEAVPPDVDVVVSTVPAGAADSLAARGWPAGVALFDVVYASWPTALARAANAADATVISGLELLVAQAVGQVELMTGRPAPYTDMRRAVGLPASPAQPAQLARPAQPARPARPAR